MSKNVTRNTENQFSFDGPEFLNRNKSSNSSGKETRSDSDIDAIIDKINRAQRKGSEAIRETGHGLIELEHRLKDRKCKYGTWGDVIQNELGLTYQTARRYMRYARAADKAEQEGNLDNLLKLPPSAIYEAFAPAVPEEAFDEVLRLPTDDQKVGMKQVRRVIKAHKSRDMEGDSSHLENRDGSEEDFDSEDDGLPPLGCDDDLFNAICEAYDNLLVAYEAADDVTREMAIDWINRYDNELKLVWRQAKRAKAA